MIDTHCHIDLYKSPLEIIKECENAGIITIGMTNLPSHFEMGYPHVLPFKKVRLALGMHPLYAKFHAKEFNGFIQNLTRTSYIGEIGLDFSREGISTKEIQLDYFKRILKELSGKKKILSLHSRRAEKEVLQLLIDFKIKNAIFHWYSGPLSVIDKIVENGYFLSVNTEMIKSDNGKKIVQRIPLNNILTETDGPFIEINGTPVKPINITDIINYLATEHNTSFEKIEKQVEINFMHLLDSLK